ncbi:MAG TPA: Ig-like domain-containing protein [Nitrosopumilaceae archaeon]|nr:Ig-like domain-containing protein [Nitrosopumilaceae archaeon]
MRKFSQLFAAFLLISILASSPTALIAAQKAGGNTVNLNLAPSIIEPGSGTQTMGYLSIKNSAGVPTPAQSNLEVRLASSNPSVASVPSSVTIPTGHEFVNFEITPGAEGQTEITANYGGHVSSQKFRVGDIPVIIPEDAELKINLPSSLMRVNTEMPMAVFLKFNGTVLKAHKDIEITFDYEKSLIKPSEDKIIIKKGNYYGLATIKTLEKAGNAFIKASAPEFKLNSAASIQISSTAPASVKINVFPSFIAHSEKKFDLVVSLHDSAGFPTVATDDVKLELFSNYTRLQDSFDKEFANMDATIKKGSYGYYLRQAFTFLPPEQDIPQGKDCKVYQPDKIIVGASAQGLGISTNMLTVTEPLSEDDDKAKIKEVKVFVPNEMPNNATSVVGYQVGTIETDEDDARAKVEKELENANDAVDTATDLVDQANALLISLQENPNSTPAQIATAQQGLTNAQILLAQNQARVNTLEDQLDDCIENDKPIDDLPEGTFYPVQSNTIYSSDKLYNNLKIISSDQNIARIDKPGNVDTASSFGTSLISSGQKAGNVNISAVLGGLGSGSNNTSIVNQLKPSKTVIFTPIGDGKIIFNSEGYYDLFVVSLDSVGRPTSSKNPIKYIIEPINEFAEINPQQTFAKVEGQTWPSTGASNAPLSTSATPIGIDSEATLKTTAALQLVSSSPTAKLMMAVDSIAGVESTNPIGVVQIIDFNGNPYPVPADLVIILKSDKPKSVGVPSSVTIPKGSSFAEFPVTTFGLKDTAKISTVATNVLQSQATISVVPYVAKLKISNDPITTPLVANQDIPVKIFIDDQYNSPAEGVTVRLSTDVNGTASPDSATTDSKGEATFTFKALQGKSTAITVHAIKSGYEEQTKTINLDVLYVPGIQINWVLYVAMGGAVAVVAVVALVFLRKPKELSDEEQEEI